MDPALEILHLKTELARVTSQRNKAWRDRADLHAQLRRITSSTSHSALLTSPFPQKTASPPQPSPPAGNA